ncbi:MAG: NAD-glutamate dehydrogenase [Acidimicrobiaceae bacterium]|nr:NAD-glutamate dehydrogenase [Acidimicrobiaceae bacterium]
MGDNEALIHGAATLETGTIDAVVDLARERHPDDVLLQTFMGEYYRELPGFDLDGRSPDDLYAVALTHYGFGSRRPANTTLLRVFSPDRERDGWFSDRSVLLLVTDDAPFLVDTVRMVIERHGIATHLMVHPMLRIDRDDHDQLTGVESYDGDGDGVVEAWTQIELDGLDDELAAELQDDLTTAVAGVHAAVCGFEPMRDRMHSFGELDPILDWLADDNFVFLSASRYELADHGEARLVEGSVLGDASYDDVNDPPIDWDGDAVTIARSERESQMHRPARLTVVTILSEGDDLDGNGRPVAERFVGLLASSAYRESVLSIPTVGDRARGVLGLAHFGAETHTGRSMRNVLETLPRDLVFEVDSERLAQLVIDVVGLQERQIVRVFDVPEPVGASSTILVFLPKRRYHARMPEQVARLVGDAYGSPPRDVEAFLGASSLARVTFTLVRGDDPPDLDELSMLVDERTTSWIDRVHHAAVEQLGEVEATELMTRLADAAPDSYRTAVEPATAVGDLERLRRLLDREHEVLSALVHDLDAAADHWRMRVYRRDEPIALSSLLPMLANLGLTVLDEHPYEFRVEATRLYAYDIGVCVPDDVTIDDRRHREVRAAFEGLVAGTVESDGFNRLVLLAGLTARQVDIIRVYAKYTHQIGFTFSQGYLEETFARLPELAALLVELFEARFDPELDEAERLAQVSNAEAEILQTLDGVPSLDDDRIGRMFLALVRATVRTNAYLDRPTTALKFDPAKVPDLPEPKPAHEIFVCSSRVEGVHLRGGPIARGGLRWSDRPEDYRTEVLGLVKAQMVKNAVIVPAGAKGGFVVKQPRSNPAEQRDEGVACYRLFVSGLLDITDNIVDGRVVPPRGVRRYDGDDPYLVVAADKGTASFSDLANHVAGEYGFWLGDAFASGGSDGYDHKAMGITARGAWESARRHARVMGKNADTDELTVVGIGDMSGDVFGNGLLRSSHLRLVAAFDHRHIFIDPDPDPKASYEERRRLFETPRSSWADYDTSLISTGGGVYSRSMKAIDLTPEAQAALGTTVDRVTPNRLIQLVLRAPVDMLWNGGVGTYVKATSESHGDVGDRSNDAVRVDADELRCRMVVEGGNLGVTQLGRVQYAVGGGLIYTDAIDNSAGVDCSDHEVNIKVLLREAMEAGELTLTQRNELLEEMTDEVAELVLANNQAQTLALLIARTQGLPMVNVHARYLDQLELEGWLDRSLEFLPTDKQIAERQAAGSGLRTPEFAVMIAYTKNANITEILRTDLPDDPALEEDLFAYFPTPLRERYRRYVAGHRLRREIKATQLVNQMVNLSGISFDHRMTEDSGASVTDVSRAWLVAREVLDFPTWWAEIDELEHMSLDDQLAMYLDCRRTAERCSMWFLRHRRPPLDVAAEVARFREPVLSLADDLQHRMRGPIAEAALELADDRRLQGVPDRLATRSAVWRVLHTALDVVELARRLEMDHGAVADTYWELFARLELLWVWDGIGSLPRSDRWQTQARSALRDDLLGLLIGLTENVIELDGGGLGAVDRWIGANERSVERATQQLTEIRRAESFNITNLSVVLRQLRNLAQTSVRGV